jgi:UDP-glucuronate 4-epimerase
MMNILVTGCAGFIGSNLVDRLLSLGFRVVGIDNFDRFYSEQVKLRNIQNAIQCPNFCFVRGDIQEKNTLANIFDKEKIELVVHLAAKAGVRPSIDNPNDYYEANLLGTLNVLDAMKLYKINKLVFASSSSIYGNNIKVPFSESDTVDHPISPYAATKKAGELLCHTYHHLYGFNVYCLRFFTVYGPRQRPDLAIHKFTDLIMKNEMISVYGDGSSKRDYTYIEDILDGIIASIHNVSGYEVINLGESRTISLFELLDLLSKNLGRELIVKKLPMQPGDVNITYADISKARKLLHYDPKWDFEKGLQEFIKWKLNI